MPILTGPEQKPKNGVAKQLIVFLHGVGSNGDDLISLAPMLADHLPDAHFLSPNAPEECPYSAGGYQWFDLYDRSPGKMIAGTARASVIVNAYLDEQRARLGLSDANIALVGFSQGTMTSLYAATHRDGAIAGVVGFAGALLSAEGITATPPICLIHGEEDTVVPFGAMAYAQDALRKANVAVESHARPMLGHGIDPEGIELAAAFLQRVLGC